MKIRYPTQHLANLRLRVVSNFDDAHSRAKLGFHKEARHERRLACISPESPKLKTTRSPSQSSDKRYRRTARGKQKQENQMLLKATTQ